MPGQKSSILDWPYVEGLRMDEAMNDLAIFATGMYGKLLTAANGAPFRMVVPWKYGFKSIKGIVKIELVDGDADLDLDQCRRQRIWLLCQRQPEVNHPRWSQATERRIGEIGSPRNIDVQRLCRRGRIALRRHGLGGRITNDRPFVPMYAKTGFGCLRIWAVAMPCFGCSGIKFNDNLSINPIDDYTDRTGGRNSLAAVVTGSHPVQTVTGWRQVQHRSQVIGTLCLCLCRAAYVGLCGLDYGFSLEFILLDGFPSKPYILVGLGCALDSDSAGDYLDQGDAEAVGQELGRGCIAGSMLAGFWPSFTTFGWSRFPLANQHSMRNHAGALVIARIPVVRNWLTELRPKKTCAKASAGQQSARKRPRVIAKASTIYCIVIPSRYVTRYEPCGIRWLLFVKCYFMTLTYLFAREIVFGPKFNLTSAQLVLI